MSSTDDFEQFGAKKLSPEQSATFFGVALFVAALPAYYFNTVYELSFGDFAIVFLPLTVLSALALVFGYKTVTDGTYARLSFVRGRKPPNHKKMGLSREAAEAMVAQVTRQESVMWSFFFNNALFVFSFMFFALYALKAVSTPYCYTISMVISAVLVWQGSSMMA